MLFRLLHRQLRQGLSRTFYIILVLGLLPAAAATRLEPGTVSKLDTAATAKVSLTISTVNSPPIVVYLESPVLQPLKENSELPSTALITSVNANFEPHFQVVSATTPILVSSKDYFPHNTHVFSRSGTSFNIATPFPGKSVSRTLNRSGIFSIRCDLHPRMKAWIFSPPNLHYAVLQDTGPISFSGLPPGHYNLHLWQAGEIEQVRSFELTANESISIHFQ